MRIRTVVGTARLRILARENLLMLANELLIRTANPTSHTGDTSDKNNNSNTHNDKKKNKNR